MKFLLSISLYDYTTTRPAPKNSSRTRTFAYPSAPHGFERISIKDPRCAEKRASINACFPNQRRPILRADLSDPRQPLTRHLASRLVSQPMSLEPTKHQTPTLYRRRASSTGCISGKHVSSFAISSTNQLQNDGVSTGYVNAGIIRSRRGGSGGAFQGTRF